jgi:hypothetical protein
MSTPPRKRENKKGKAADDGRKTSRSVWNPHSALRTPQFLYVALSLVVFAGIPFALGKYFELKCPDPFDSGSYVYSAQHVLSGARIGYEEKPSAQAGTLLVNMLGVELTGFNETGSKLLQALFQAAALTLMFFTIKRLYGTLAAVISVAVASIYLSAPVIAKFGNVKEQFMIALMIAGICCFVWYRLTGRWWWALLTGTLLIGGPLFKQTGVAAIAAIGLFVLVGPFLYHHAWKTVGKDILLLVAGAMVTLTPICVWYASMGTPLYYWPYSFALGPVFKLAGAHLEYVADTGQAPQEPAAPAQEVKKTDDSIILRLLPGYVSDSWRMLGPAERKESLHRVLRYYRVLILPIALAFGALVSRVVVLLRRRQTPAKAPVEEDPGRFVLLLGLWWFFDMAFVWISPHSYEQYYLPLNASSAFLGGYFVGLYADRFQASRDRTRWIILGLVGVLAMIVMSWHIFFGIAKSPHSGGLYRDQRTGQPTRTRGYLQKWQEVRANGQYPWIMVGDYVRQHSQASDSLYVWGWVPGIYVQAQRMSPTPKAFEGTMHTLPPQQLADRVQEILKGFEKNPPKFIVDTRKIHFPWTRPVLELWPNVMNGIRLLGTQPRTKEQFYLLLQQAFDIRPNDLMDEPTGKPTLFLRLEDAVARRYDAAYGKLLRERIEPAEAVRYEAMQPLRSYVMKNYRIVGEFDANVLFQRK